MTSIVHLLKEKESKMKRNFLPQINEWADFQKENLCQTFEKIKSSEPFKSFQLHSIQPLRTLLDEKIRNQKLHSLNSNLNVKRIEINRSFQFWIRSVQIYSSYKVCQAKASFLKDKDKINQVWEKQHENAAEEIYKMCIDLGGFFLKSGQFLAKPDLVPKAWVEKLKILHDSAPANSFSEIQTVIEEELNEKLENYFSYFDPEPLGSASIAQVHRAKLKSNNTEVAVKVQHPNCEELMLMDLANQKFFAKFLQNFELPFDLLSIYIELENQVKHEFNFYREAKSMDEIAEFLATGQKISDKKRAKKKLKNNSPIIVPRSIPNMVTRRVLVMDYVKGTPIMRLEEEMKKRGINPKGNIALMAKKNILKDLSTAYGMMMLKNGHFQADPHPGNILICERGKVALLDYGQTKMLSTPIRINFAKLILAIDADDVKEIGKLFGEIGIETTKTVEEEASSFRRMANIMFDTKITNEFTTSNPFAEESSLKRNGVKRFPQEMFFVLRTIQLLRGLAVGMDVTFSVASHWKPLAEQVLAEEDR